MLNSNLTMIFLGSNNSTTGSDQNEKISIKTLLKKTLLLFLKYYDCVSNDEISKLNNVYNLITLLLGYCWKPPLKMKKKVLGLKLA